MQKIKKQQLQPIQRQTQILLGKLIKKFLICIKVSFGVSLDVCFNILKKNIHNKNISIEGLSVHIGSQIKELAPFQKTLKVVDKFLIKLKNNGINISFLDLGGGMGIPYSKSDKKFDLKKYANLVHTSVP